MGHPGLAAVDLRTNTLRRPSGVDTPAPEFAWRLDGEGAQDSYAIQVSSTAGFTDGALLWDSGRVESSKPYGVRYAGAPLGSRQSYWWRVRVWPEETDAAEDWSEPAGFETAMFDPGEWRARWIGRTGAPDGDESAIYLRGAVDLAAPVVRGRAYVTALGWYRFFVNGTDLTGPALVPRWTPFDHYLEYQAYDVTD